MPERSRDPGAPQSMRLFVAVELPDVVRSALAGAIGDLQNAGTGEALRWVRPEGIHLTLKFLGATPPDRVAPIVDALRTATARVQAFDLRPAGFGSFHGGRHMPHEFERSREAYHYNLRVVWVGVDGATEQLGELAEYVESALNPLGYARERAAFFPHLTLARVRDDAGREARIALWRVLEPYLSRGTRTGNFRPELVRDFPEFHVKHLSLMESQLGRGGAVYRALETFALEAGS